MVAAICSACSKTTYGPTLEEAGEIYDTCFVPKGHGSDVAIGYNAGKGGGLTVTPVDITIPARYAVVFKCQHGKFVIDGERGMDVYKKFDKGDKVTIRYCEVFEVTKDSTNAVDLHFIEAIPLNQ